MRAVTYLQQQCKRALGTGYGQLYEQDEYEGADTHQQQRKYTGSAGYHFYYGAYFAPAQVLGVGVVVMVDEEVPELSI